MKIKPRFVHVSQESFFLRCILRRISCRRSPLGAWTPSLVVALLFSAMTMYQEFFARGGDAERFWSFSVGLQILATHVVPSVSGPDTFYAGMPYPQYEWLYCVLTAFFVNTHLYWIFILLHGVALSASMFFVLGSCLRYRVSPFWTMFLVSSFCASQFFWSQIRSETLVVGLFPALLVFAETRFAALWVFAILLFWSNIHGSFVLAILSLAGRIGRPRWLELLFVGILATCINPQGPQSWITSLHFPASFFSSRIIEWEPATSTPNALVLIAIMLFPAAFLALTGHRRKIVIRTNWLSVFAMLYFAMRAVRFVKYANMLSFVPLAALYRGGPRFRPMHSWILSIIFMPMPTLITILSMTHVGFVREPIFGLLSFPTRLEASSDLIERLPHRVCVDDFGSGSVLVAHGRIVNATGELAIPTDHFDAEWFATEPVPLAIAISAEPCEAAILEPSRYPGITTAMVRRGWLVTRTEKFFSVFVRPYDPHRPTYHPVEETPAWHLFG